MLKKLCGLARALYILLAIVAGFMVLGTMNTALILVVLGLVAGIAMEKENYVPAAATAIALPIIGAALGTIPPISSSESPALWQWRSPSPCTISSWTA